MRRYNFTKEEVCSICSKAYLNELQKRILEYRLLDYSIVEMAMKENCSESKISKELSKLDKKIKRVV